MAIACPKCQAENKDGSKFCKKCGGRLELKCPACGSPYEPDSDFCNECGHDLTKPKPPLDYSEPQTYTPKFLAYKILTERQSMEGERKLVTVLFADVAGYTSMSEKLDTEEVRQIMDGCFHILMDEIHRYEGTITQFTGDGAMALFGAPVAHEDHAQRACYAALAIQKGLEGYGEKVKKDCGIDFKMRIGLNSGPVIVGSVGADLKMDYTAVGDTVNLASRMQTLAQPGGVLVAPASYRMAQDFFQFQPMGKLKVKGKQEPVSAYQLLKATEVATRIEAAIERGLTRFVGRDKEMATLRESFDKAKSGSGQVVGIVGEAGVGKSRLLFEMRRMLPEGEYTYLQGRCLHYGGSMPYLPFLDILRTYFGIEEGDREYLIKKKMTEKVRDLEEKLEDILPPLQDILSLKVEDESYLKMDAPLKRVKIFEAIRDILIRESQRRPLLIAVEDLHWIDKTSEEFLGYLIGFLANTPVLLLLLYRPEYTHQWGSKSYYRQIGVDQLSLLSSAELVQSILEEGEVAPELKNLILTTSAGNPLFMEEFTHSLLENGSIQRKDHQYVLTRKASEIAVPDTIQAIIAARMDRLEDNLKRTMQVASVIGRDFAYRILQTITGMREDLKSHLVNLQGLEFIYEKSLFPELEYIFKHALIQEVAYNSLLIKRRKEIHQRIGKAIEDIYADRLEEFYEALSHHYSKAENAEKAYHYLKLSGDKATKNYAKWEALAFYHGAIELLKKEPDTEDNKRKGIEIRLLMSTPMRYVAYPEGSLPILEEGEKMARGLGDQKALAYFLSLIGLYYTFRGDPLRGLEYAEECFKEADRIEDVDLMAAVGLQLCTSYTVSGQHLKVVEIAPKVIALLEKTQRQSESFGWGYNVHAALFLMYGLAASYLGDFRKGEALLRKGHDLALELNDLYCIGNAELFHAISYSVKGDGHNTVKHSQNAIKCLEEAQFMTLLGIAWLQLGQGYHLLGELNKARESAEKGLEIQRSVGLTMGLAWFHWILGLVQLDLGDLAKAQAYVEQGVLIAQSSDEQWTEARLRSLLTRILVRTDKSQSADAEQCIMDSIETIDKVQLRPFCSTERFYLGELYVSTGQSQKAMETLKKAESEFEQMGMDYWLRRTQEVLAGLPG